MYNSATFFAFAQPQAIALTTNRRRRGHSESELGPGSVDPKGRNYSRTSKFEFGTRSGVLAGIKAVRNDSTYTFLLARSWLDIGYYCRQNPCAAYNVNIVWNIVQ